MMAAMQLVEFGKPLKQAMVPKPRLRPEDVLVNVKAAGVCGTDLKIIAGNHPKVPAAALPRILGHEVAGTVVALGERVSKEHSFLLGKDVVVYFYESCGSCGFCRSGREPLCEKVVRQYGFTWDGGFAQYMAVAARNVIPFEGLDHHVACILADAVGTAYHAVASRAQVKPGELVVILGCGGLGIHAVQVAKLMGAEVIGVDINRVRIDAASRFGADRGLEFEELMKNKGSVAADVVVDTIGNSQTVRASLELLKKGGRLVVVGYIDGVEQSVYLARAVKKEICVLGSLACGFKEVEEVVRLAMRGKLTPVVGRVFPLSLANEAIEHVKMADSAGRVVLSIQE
ncbi:MAG: alcohol dehydrogenase catalytic domain-containing protein [Bacillota bacterium]